MWLALRFPHWALDSRQLGTPSNAPVLIVETRQGRRCVVAADAQAMTAGVRRAMALADAQVRVPDAQIVERHLAPEKAALERLAGWAWCYSDQVHVLVQDTIDDSAGLIVEIGASLRLFGGRRALFDRMRQDLQRLGYRYVAGTGDTPEAALVFARAPRRGRRRALHELPIGCLSLAAAMRASLQASGVKRVGELLALPSSALHKRYGSELLDYLERLRGRRPHGLALYRLPERYATRHELFGAIESIQGLAFVLRRVFTELEAFLRGADAVIQTLRLTLTHDSLPNTQRTLRLSRPTRTAAHLERVAADNLSRLELAAPVLEIALATDRLRRQAPTQANLCAQGQSTDGEYHWTTVLDRLRARLGHDGVTWLAAPADHRPERASAHADSPQAIESRATPPRPLWLLDPPRPAPADLTLIQGPERIETGWWDGASVRRDYFRALDTQGRQLWVYRRLEPPASGAPVYYLHGLFG